MYPFNVGIDSLQCYGNPIIAQHQIQQSNNGDIRRLYLGNTIDGTVVAFSPQITSQGQQSIQQPQVHNPENTHPHIQLPAPSSINIHHSNGMVQTHPELQAQDHFDCPPHITDCQINEIAKNRNINAKDFSDVVISDNIVISDESKLMMSNKWCLSCNQEFLDDGYSQVVDIATTKLTTTGRKLSTLLKRITTFGYRNLHSRIICHSCLQLMEEIDNLELKLSDLKMKFLKQYKTTLNIRQPEVIFNIKYDQEDFGDITSSDTASGIESSEEDDPADPDVTPETLRNSRDKRPTKRNKRCAKKSTKLSKFAFDLNIGHTKGKQKRRGRPLKMEKDELVFPGETTKECPCCKKVVQRSMYLKHILTHRMFPCPFCSSIFRRKDINSHIAEFHQEESEYPCSECSQIMESFTVLRKHALEAHVGLETERERCSVCEKTFSSRNALKVHFRSFHAKPESFQCHICKESFSQKGNMQSHIKRIHFSDKFKKFTCSTCGKTFICPSDLQKHVDKFHLKRKKFQVVCDTCKKTFSDARALKIHVNAIHTKEIQYPCPDCKMVFYCNTNLLTHRRRMHCGESARKYTCSTCGKGFCSPSDLKIHVSVVHDKSRKHVCDVCGQGFKVASHLKYHRRKHTGETPYSCPHCAKTFHGPSHISDHVKKVHKTIYVGINERRKLNIPDDAPPPPPGIISKTKPNVLVNQPESCPTRVLAHPNQSNSVSTISMQQIQSGAMLPPLPQQNYMVQSSTMTEPPSVVQNSYPSVQFEQTQNQTSFPMVVRLLHEMQY